MSTALMPESRDIAALPTSWALTIWDALPVYLSVEVAVALVIVVVAGSRLRTRLWQMSSIAPAGGIIYLAIFDIKLAGALLVVALVQLAIAMAGRIDLSTSPAPDVPLDALRDRGGSVIWSVAKASLIAAVVKTLLTPAFPVNSPVWIVVAGLGGLVSPGPLGSAAIPALATQSASNSFAIGCLWIIAASLRPVAIDRLLKWRRTAGELTGVGQQPESRPPHA